ncbi:MAG TPA: hypothetical protein PK969_12140 [Treponemataceae bacterium]|nr:hypothetical protein [Treponemataceae bacterium]
MESQISLQKYPDIVLFPEGVAESRAFSAKNPSGKTVNLDSKVPFVSLIPAGKHSLSIRSMASRSVICAR